MVDFHSTLFQCLEEGTSRGNVGVGVVTPTEVLDVGGNIKGVNIEAIKGIKIGNTSDTDAGTIRWTGTDFEGYNGTQWISLTTGGTAVSPGYTDCVNAGGNWVNSQGLCYIPGTSCPSGWTSKENYSSTRSESCGFDAGCWDSQLNVNYYISPCGTGQHIRQNKSIEECFFNGCSYLPYDRWQLFRHSNRSRLHKNPIKLE